MSFTALLCALITTGFAFMVYEIVFLRELLVTLGGTVYASSATLAAVMLGLFVGSQVFGWLCTKVKNTVLLLVFMEAGLLILAFFSVPLLRFLGSCDSWGLRYVLSIIVILLPSALVGGEIPVAVQFLGSFVDQKKIGFYTGLVYGADTLGALLGALAVPFILLPFLGAYKTSLAAGIANGLTALILIPLARTPKKNIVFLVCLLLAESFLTASPLSRRIDHESALLPYPQKKLYKAIFLNKLIGSPYQRIHVVGAHLKPGGLNKISDTNLVLDGSYQSGTLKTYLYKELILLALLSHESPENVLLIGCGDGDLLSSVLTDPRVKHVDHVEIDAHVIESVKQYMPDVCSVNGQLVWEDPRVHLTIGDGRHFLKNTGKKYDLIYTDLPHVNHETASVFYSKEFFQLAHDKLAAHGIFMTHAYSNDRHFFAGELTSSMIVLKTLKEIFDDKTLFFWKNRMPMNQKIELFPAPAFMGHKGTLSLAKEDVAFRLKQLSPAPALMNEELFFLWMAHSQPPDYADRFPVSTDDKPCILYPYAWKYLETSEGMPD